MSFQQEEAEPKRESRALTPALMASLVLGHFIGNICVSLELSVLTSSTSYIVGLLIPVVLQQLFFAPRKPKVLNSERHARVLRLPNAHS